MSAEYLALGAIAALAVGGALSVVFAKELMRLVIGLGVFLLGVAGLYLYNGFALLATGQVFLYVGGVLVLLVFAIMVVHRSQAGRPVLEVRHDVGSLAVAAAVALLIGLGLSDTGIPLAPAAGAPDTAAAASAQRSAAEVLLGSRLAAFELVGALLLTALVAALVIVGGRDRS